MNQNDEKLLSFLRTQGLSHCPHCQAAITAANVVVGWNTRAEDDTPLGPAVWMTCKQCGQHVKFSKSVPHFAQSQDDALKALEIA